MKKTEYVLKEPKIENRTVDYSGDGIYSLLNYGSPIVNRGLQSAVYYCQRYGTNKKVLCVGSGNAYEAVWFLMQNADCYVAELYHPQVKILHGRQVKALGQELPFKNKEFDLLFCCETLEHITEKENDRILSEAKRVSNEVFFTIATRDDPPFYSHICIHEGEWWINKFRQMGFDLINAQINATHTIITQFNGQSVATNLNYGDGVLIHARC